MATTTTHDNPASPKDAIQKQLHKYHQRCLDAGTYLPAPTKEFAWYTVPATKASYLIDAANAPSSTEVDPSSHPPPTKLSMILKVFFFVLCAIYFAEALLRFLRTIGSSVLKRIGLLLLQEQMLKKTDLLTRPSSLFQGGHLCMRTLLTLGAEGVLSSRQIESFLSF